MFRKKILKMEACREIDEIMAKEFMNAHTLDDLEHRRKCGTGGWSPSTNISAAFEVEEKIKKMGLGFEYSHYLREVVNYGKKKSRPWVAFDLIHATAHQKCRAALLTIMEKKERGK